MEFDKDFIVSNVFGFLSAPELAGAGLASSRHLHFSRFDSLWRSHAERRWADKQVPPPQK
jgi:hypothetical protein